MVYRDRFLRSQAMKACAAFALLATALAAQAEIQYKVTIRDGQRLAIEMTVPTPGQNLSVQMPNWAPGAYILSYPGKGVEDFKAADASGKNLTVEHPNDFTWTISGAPSTAKISYTVAQRLNAGAVNYSGPSTYLYVVGRKEEPCRLTLDVPSGWKIATGLDEGRGKTYTAPTYDVFADSPVTVGDIREGSYIARGKPHLIALYGSAKDDVDLAYLTKACKFVSEMECDLFGGAPYKRYVWHFSVNDSPDGAGGLEHLNSTQIGLASGVGPRAVGVLAHEFFHLWNVKRIRSKPLGPFDYTELPKTGALWWLEGVTDYYAHTLLVRYGWDNRLYGDVLSNYKAVQARPERLEISPYDSSYRVGEANNGRGNSNGYKVSYYDTGWLVGMCLDIEILSQSNGKHSLDDVLLGLWNLCKDDKPGFEEDEIRKQCVRYGGSALGAFYDQIVMKPGNLPVELQLAKVGLRMTTQDQVNTDLGFAWQPAAATGNVKVSTVRGAAEKLLQEGDVIMAINDMPVIGKTRRALTASFNAATEKIKPGQTITLKIDRGGKQSGVELIAGSTTQQVPAIEEVPNARPEAVKLRSLWTAKRRR